MKAYRCLCIVLALVGCSPGSKQGQVAVAPGQAQEPPKEEPPRAQPEMNAFDRAIEALRDGRIDEAIALLEEHIEGTPQDARAKAVLAQVLQQKAQGATKEGRWDLAGPWFLEAAKLAREIRPVKGLKIDTESLYIAGEYNEACTYSHMGEIDKALDSLEEALRAGFLEQMVSEGPSPRELLVSDIDLDPIRDTDRFRELKAHYLREEQPVAPPSHDPPTP